MNNLELIYPPPIPSINHIPEDDYFTIEDMARWFRVPPHLIAPHGKSKDLADANQRAGAIRS